MIKYDKWNNVQTFKINVVKSAFGKVRDSRIDALVSGDVTFFIFQQVQLESFTYNIKPSSQLPYKCIPHKLVYRFLLEIYKCRHFCSLEQF